MWQAPLPSHTLMRLDLYRLRQSITSIITASFLSKHVIKLQTSLTASVLTHLTLSLHYKLLAVTHRKHLMDSLC